MMNKISPPFDLDYWLKGLDTTSFEPIKPPQDLELIRI